MCACTYDDKCLMHTYPIMQVNKWWVNKLGLV